MKSILTFLLMLIMGSVPAWAALGGDVQLAGPRRVVARPQSAGQCVSGTRKTDLHVAACQRHDRLPPKAAGPPPLGPIVPQPSCF